MTQFASPPVVIVASTWKWDLAYMLTHFGWKAVIGIILSNLLYLTLFRRESPGLNPTFQTKSKIKKCAGQFPGIHFLFLCWTVANAHYPVLVILGLLFFLAFGSATRLNQHAIALRSPLLVGFFLAALITDEVYFDRVSQIQMDTWSQGRVGLIGDAAFCPSLLAGQGAALAMTAAYVLAGELAQTGGAPQQAFKRYENRLHAFIAGKQKSATDFAGSFTPKTRLGLFFRNQVSKMFRLPFIAEFALNPNVGLIHPPTVVGRSEPRSQSALNFWGVTLHPPPDGDVVDRKSALGKKFFHLAVEQREAQVPANRQQDDLRFELPPLEKTRNRRREQVRKA